MPDSRDVTAAPAPLTIRRVLAAPRRGSSRPVVVATDEGVYLAKLRGAAQGAGALVAELIVGGLAEVLNLPVLPRRLLLLSADTPREDREDELADLLDASTGVNLGVPLLEGARDAGPAELATMSNEGRAATLWLDRFVLNADRTARNPNILVHRSRLFLIDHGSALRFQYAWPTVTEATPRAVGVTPEPHLFEAMATAAHWRARDERFAERVTRDVLQEAVAAVPPELLWPLLPPGEATPAAVERRRAAYVAFLWKRLEAPRAFALEARVAHAPRRPPVPAWVAAGRPRG